MFDQRRITPAHERYVPKRRMSPTRDMNKNLVDRRQSLNNKEDDINKELA